MKNYLKISLTVFIVVMFLSMGYEIYSLTSRIERIENKLGGAKKIATSESDIVKKARRSVVLIIGGESEGSGFAIQKGGLILTNFHVIEFEPNPKVILPDYTFETAEIAMADRDADLAIIKIKKDLPVLRLAKLDGMSPAEEVFAMGYPLGGNLPGESAVIRGSFSRFAEDKKNGVRYLITDITMIPGISGGPMVNSYGEVVGINTLGLASGGMGLAISSDSIRAKCLEMAKSEDPLKNVEKTIFEPNKNALEAVKAFYNYIKARKLEKAFELLSDNFVKGYSFEQWAWGYRPQLDTSIVLIKRDKEATNRINIKLSTKDLIDNDIVYKYFEGYWDVRKINGKWLLWKPRIREVIKPDEEWFIDQDLKKQMIDLANAHEDFEKYMPDMYKISEVPGNEELTLLELYDIAKGKIGGGR